MLWYNSNGFENDAPQTPRQIMNNSIARKKALAWMKKIGVAGIKVDFVGGDKQETMKLYEDILSDANDYGLEVIFHGCTMPRGWERRYPNYVSSEAALASENGKPLKKASGVRYVSADKELHHVELASGFYQLDIKQK